MWSLSEEQVGNAGVASGPLSDTTSGGDSMPIDVEKAMEQMDGDRELFDDVVGVFVGTIPGLIDGLRAACEDCDGDQLAAVAHNLKGASANVCAEPMHRAALRLEQFGTQADFANIEAVLAELDSHLESLRAYVKTMASS
jgi:HPt (histidine-containing phosphotransfer) domain-containing protein